MSDVLKLSRGTGKEESNVVSALQLAENKKRIKELERNIADLEALKKAQAANAQQGQGKGPDNKIGARKNANFKAVSTAPSINKTPVGSSTPPLPYPTSQDLSNSVNVTPTVRFNADPVVVLDRSKQPSGTGDDPGTAKGIKSNTVNGEVKPTGACKTVRCEGKQTVRENDPNTMNGGNNPGIYITTQSASDDDPESAEETSNPPPAPETPAERSAIGKWWDNAKSEMGEAVDHPWEGLKGAGKGIANIPSHLAELLMKGSALQGAGDMQQAAAMQALLGNGKNASDMLEIAEAMRQNVDSIDVPKFSMNNKAQAGGDKISTAVQLLAGGAGLAKSGVGMLGTLGKASRGAEAANATGGILGTLDKTADAAGVLDKSADAAKAVGAVDGAADAAKASSTVPATADAAAEAGGAGVKVLVRAKSLRLRYLGKTPGKGSRTGKEVQARMRSEGTLRDRNGKTEFKASDGQWHDLSKADMAHNTDAVKWWNETGRQYGAKAPEVRNWMLDSKNYTLDHYSLNRSAGASLPDRYLPPLK